MSRNEPKFGKKKSGNKFSREKKYASSEEDILLAEHGRNGNLAAVVDVILELSSGCWWSWDLCRVVEHDDCLEALWNEVELAADG